VSRHRPPPEGAIAIDDPSAPDVRDLLETHLTFARAQTPPKDVHALDVEELADASVTLVSFRRGGELLAVGALKRLDGTHAELKSMHTRLSARGQGIARELVRYLLALARARGFNRVSLETGSMTAFEAARTLYAGAGFRECPPFGDYVDSPNSTYMTLHLEPTQGRDGSSSSPGYPGDLPGPPKSAPIESHDDEDQGAL
jgi:putative acetyltransferase